jgi:hypothetical protein
LPDTGPELELAQGDSSNTPDGGRQVNLCNMAVNPNVNGNNGIVYVVWAHLLNNPGSPSSESIEMSRSFDYGQTIDGVQTLTYFTRTPAIVGNDVQLCKSDFGCVEGYIDPSSGTHTGFDAVGSPSLAIDSQNNLGLAYQNYRSAQLTDVNFMKISGCTTTSTCIYGSIVNVANDDDIARDQFFPFIVFSPSKNAYHIVAMDKRNSGLNVHWEHFDYHCHIDADCGISTNWQVTQVSAAATTNLDISPTDHIGDYYSPSDGSQLELVTNWIVGSEINHMRIYSDRTLDETYSVKTGTFVKSVLSSTPQVASPIMDNNVGSWTFAPLWQKLDEYPADDADYITSPSETAPQFEVKLGNNLIDPLSSTNHVIKVRAKSTGSGPAETATLQLFQGATQKATSGAISITRNAFSTLTYTLTPAQADSITDYTNLSVRVVISKAANEVIQVSWVDFEVPAAPAIDSILDLKFTPKALILFTTGQTGEGTTDGYRFSIGYSDGTNSRSIGIASDNNIKPSNTGRAFGTKALTILSSGAPTISAQADATFLPTGFKITWTTNDSVQAKIHYIAMGGPDATNSLVSSFTAPTITGPRSETIGFQPDFLMFMHARSMSDTSPGISDAYISYGFAVSPTKRAAIAVDSEDGARPTLTREIQRTDRAIVGLADTTGGLDTEADLVSMDPTGFTLNWLNPPTNADKIYYLAIKGGQYDIGSLTKTSSGQVDQPVSISNLDLQPRGVILSSINAAASTAVQNGDRISFGVSDITNEGATWSADSNGVQNSITARSETATKAIRLATEAAPGSSSMINAEADLTSLNVGSFNLSWTTNNNPTSQTEAIFAAFGNQPIRTISGYAFDDTNDNGSDNSEPRLANWNIRLIKNSVEVASMRTTSLGEFKFTGLSSGSYTITEDVESGWINTTPVSIGPIDLTGVNTVSANNKFGDFKYGQISGIKYNDTNGDGTQNAGELGLQDWIIELRDSGGALVSSMNTDASGAYSFSSVRGGTFTVSEVLTSGYVQTAPAAGTFTINVLSGTVSVNNDFGNQFTNTGPNVVGDPGFETGSLAVYAPEPRGSWGSTGTNLGGQVFVTSEDKHTGANSLKIITTSNSQSAYVYQYFTLGSTTYSYSFWYKGSSGLGTGEVIRGWGPPSPLVGGPYNPQAGAVMQLGTASFPLDGQWHRATVVNTPTTQAFYLDGVQISCGTGNSNIPDVTIIGDLTQSAHSITAYIDDVRVVSGQEYQFSCGGMAPSMTSQENPSYDVQLNQTSVNISATAPAAVELQIVWNESSGPSQPLEIIIGNVTNTETYVKTENVTHSMESISEEPSHQIFEITFNMTGEVEPGEYLVPIIVKHLETGYAKHAILKIMVE